MAYTFGLELTSTNSLPNSDLNLPLVYGNLLGILALSRFLRCDICDLGFESKKVPF